MRLITPRLLITDDDRDFRETVAGLLTERGFETLQAADGEEALQIVCRQKVHLLLLDMQMPRLSGLETIERLRQEWGHGRVLSAEGFAAYDDQVLERWAATPAERCSLSPGESSPQLPTGEWLATVPLPWILLSGALDEELIAWARANAAFSVLQKPVRLPDLTGAVTAALHRAYGWPMA